MNSHAGREPTCEDPVKEATVVALKRVVDPLLELMFDAGVTVQEFNKIARDRAVRIAMKRVVKESGRESRSRVAIMTGLPRSEVTRILASADSVSNAKPDQHPARRVLAAWHDNPRFLTTTGDPAVLSIFGKRRSFEQLVERYGGGIPVRAMLDELTQLDAIERLEDQKIRAKARVPVMTGLTSRSIAAVGERGRDLLKTLAHNVRRNSQPLFEATALIDDSDLDMVTLVRREITEQGTNFINAATSLLNRSHKKGNAKVVRSSTTCRLGVTVYYFEDEITAGNKAEIAEQHGHRKNLRRQKRKSGKENSNQSLE
jgi:hypothetical protein